MTSDKVHGPLDEPRNVRYYDENLSVPGDASLTDPTLLILIIAHDCDSKREN